jgi:ABC-type glutathione transport system ATPase component
MTVLRLRGLTVRAGTRDLVRGVDLDVDAGRVTALAGPSGAGKTVTARACLGVVDVAPGLVAGSLHLPPLGEMDWFAGGADSLRERLAPLRGRVLSYAPQAASSALNPGRTIGRHLELAVRRRSPAPTAAQTAVILRDALAEVGLDLGVAAALPGELSGGQNQRAALAIAVACAPRVLVADEPETGLDPILRRQIVELLVEVGRRHACGILLVTHHADTVARVADRVVRLGLAEAA